MSTVRRILAAIYDFVVGDDWRLALGAVGALGGVALLVAAGVDGWWFAPLFVLAVLVASLLSARETPGPPDDVASEVTPSPADASAPTGR